MIYPESFAVAAVDVAAKCGLELEVWDEEKLKAERCGSLLAVARGSIRPPRLLILRHHGGQPGDAPLALVGKGVTFDSGGLSIKPTDGMKTMKCDMAGAATVLGAMQAIAQLSLPVNVIGLVGLVENMISGDSYKLGDVLTARSGKTIEVLNTDAEGRLVLADVLDVAVEREPGPDHRSGDAHRSVRRGPRQRRRGPDDQRPDLVRCTLGRRPRAAKQPGSSPCSPSLASRSQRSGRHQERRRRPLGGAITAAKFLEEFVAGKPWVHIDIAGPAFLEGAKPWLDAGGSGAFVRTLVEVAKGWRGSAPKCGAGCLAWFSANGND